MITKTKKLIGGHRGSPQKAHENTLESFEITIADGVDFIELDVRKSRDNQLIVHHDARSAEKMLSDLTMREIDSLSDITGYKIPLFEDVLKLCAGKIMLDVEIKEPDATSKAAELLLKYYSTENFIITSFFDDVLRCLNEKFPKIKKGLLFDNDTNHDLENRIIELKPDFLIPYLLSFGNDALSMCKKFAIKSIVWTVDKKDDIIKFLTNPYVAGIISNTPKEAVSICRQVLHK